MHDLVRQYATIMGEQHAGTDHRDGALDRLLTYYSLTLYAATSHLAWSADPAARGGSCDLQWLMAWWYQGALCRDPGGTDEISVGQGRYLRRCANSTSLCDQHHRVGVERYA
ncbi:hypothetical protein [Actinomadura sp. NEAU-AAG7]|uniref:hypothetical protein n=1 Tax=Actinomadura sp. NEAU-AAG7 TaxID=2839640 RepID=UPI001BE48CFC|nr:hypothetical protein [Actinomadura sp. NEAU-AAG7]MBT2213214.1 hypothetical protein [Actinomadura sp. NEAU-AAG7]